MARDIARRLRIGSLSLGVLAGITLGGQGMKPLHAQPPREADDGIRDRFIGAWRLVWLEEAGADGTVHRADCTGMFVFTREGRASVQVMYRNPQAGSAAGPVQYAQGGYEATFGRYEVDATPAHLHLSRRGRLIRSLVGKDLIRPFELSGNQLIVRSANPDEHWSVAWEHY